MANWFEHLMNPRSHMVKKAMFEVLQGRYPQNEQIVERISVSLLTEQDIKSFYKMVTDIYEVAYLKAVEDHRDALQKAGLAARIVPNKS